MRSTTLADQILVMQRRIARLHNGAEAASAPGDAPALAVVTELQAVLEELRVAEEDLREQGDELMLSREALEAERRRYQELFEFAPDGYLITDAAGAIREVNRAAAQLLGVSTGYLMGKPLALYVAEPDRRAFQWKLLRMEDALRPLRWQLRLQPRHGATIDAEVTLGAVRDQAGALTALRWLVHDVTDRRQAEERIRRLNAELEQRVRERTAQLEAAVREQVLLLAQEQHAAAELERAARIQDAIVAALSEQFADPLAAVKGYAHILRRLVEPLDPPESGLIAEALSGVESTATRLAVLADELIGLIQFQVGGPLLPERVDLVALARSVADERQQRTDRHSIVVETPERDLVGQWDTTRLRRVLDILVTNAVRYSPEGGTILLTLAREEDAGGRWARLAVQDEGVGIPVGDLPHIFAHFHRGANVAGWTSGTGIGLVVARQVVEQHGGTIAVDSRQGAGATFTVRLPLDDVRRTQTAGDRRA